MSKMNMGLTLLVGGAMITAVGCSNTPAKTPEQTTRVEISKTIVKTPPPTTVYVIPVVLDTCSVPAKSHAYFEFSSVDISELDEPELTDIASCLTHGPLQAASIQLVGHTDPRGSQAFNEQLGMTRAEHVAKFLEAHGVEKSRISVSSKGKQDAAAAKKDWPGDRRVDISVSMPGKAGPGNAPANAPANAPGG